MELRSGAGAHAQTAACEMRPRQCDDHDDGAVDNRVDVLE